MLMYCGYFNNIALFIQSLTKWWHTVAVIFTIFAIKHAGGRSDWRIFLWLEVTTNKSILWLNLSVITYVGTILLFLIDKSCPENRLKTASSYKVTYISLSTPNDGQTFSFIILVGQKRTIGEHKKNLFSKWYLLDFRAEEEKQ